nr:hypothetical protein [Tanacetum cinerariifolium]
NHEEGERVNGLVEEGVEDLGEIEKMEFVQDMSGCSIDQKVKYTIGSLVEEFCLSHEMQKLETELWNHVIVRVVHAAYTDRFHKLARLVPHLVTPESRNIKRNGSIKKVEKRENVRKPSKDKNGRDDNKRNGTGNAFATTADPAGRENTGAWPKFTTCNSYHALGGPCRTCFNYNRMGHLVKDCRGVPRNVNLVNARNPTVRACYECGSTDHVRSACPKLNRAQGLRENCPNQVVANNEGMDWLSSHKAEIICHEKVVKIPLVDGKVLRVLGDKPEDKIRQRESTKAKEKEQKEIVVVRYFPDVFPNDLSGLPPDNSRNSKIEVSFDQAHRLGECRIDDLFDQLQVSQFFSKIDLRSRYYQLRIVMKNPNQPNDPNVPEGEHAPAAPDGFAPQWIGEHDPNINNRWIEWDVPLGGEVDEPMVDPEVNEEEVDDDDWDDEVEWLMAPVTPPRATITVSSSYEVEGPSVVAIEGPYFPLPAPELPVPPTVIEDLGTRLGNLEYRHGVWTRKMEETVQVVSRLEEIETRVQQVESRLDTYPSGQMTVPGHDVIARSSEQVQTLQTALHETELQNQQLRTRVAEMESHMGIVMPYMLWMEERLTVLEKWLPGPPPGPQ